MLMISLKEFSRTSAQGGDPYQAWVPVGGGRDDETKEQKVLIDHEGLVAALSTSEGTTDPVASLSFLVEEEAFVCDLLPSALMAPELQEKYPLLKVHMGKCSNGGSATLVVNQAELDSVSTTIYTGQGQVFYMDHREEEIDPEVYSLVRKSDIAPDPEHALWNDEVIEYNGEGVGDRLRRSLSSQNSSNNNVSPRSLQTRTEAFTYRLAMITTRQYSLEYGNTCSAVLQGIVTGMARVNGIFLRELGVMFELIGASDDLICLDGDADCTYLRNEDANAYILQVEGFIQERDVPVSAYDLGHGLATFQGGRAALGALCSSYKARGMTGLSTPRGDLFWVDYVSHEVRTTVLVHRWDCSKSECTKDGTSHICFDSVHRLATSFLGITHFEIVMVVVAAREPWVSRQKCSSNVTLFV